MGRRFASIMALLALAALLLGSLAQVEGKTVKEQMQAELSSIRNEVLHERWGPALTHTGRLNSLWGQYRRNHAIKKTTSTNFAKNIHDLQTHLKQRSAAKVYVDLSALRAIVVLLKA